MKKTLLLGLLFAAGFGAHAQLANGTVAPDFTVTDIDGNTHSLYADYLNNGKTVIMDISATWCGPCWNYHNNHALADFYEAYGPDGSDEATVLFVEGDPTTSVESIYGTNTPEDQSTTQGNWTIGSPYPIIDSGEISDSYNIGYFPTVYRICASTQKTQELTQPSATQIRNSINTCQELVGVANHGMINPPAAVIRVCQDGDTANVVGKLKNFGNNNITAAVVELRKNGNVIATQDYAGNLAQFGAAPSITFDNVAFEAGASYKLHLTSINGVAAFNPELAEANIDFVVATTGSTNYIEVVTYTDFYPAEVSWQIKDADGAVVAESDAYQPGDEDEYGGGGPDANVAHSQIVTLPGTDAQCYSVLLKDSFGDGWVYGEGEKGVRILSGGELIFEKMVGNFGSALNNPSAFRTLGVLDNEEVEANTFAIYPNPTTGILNFLTKEVVSVTVTDITGKVVFSAKEINNGDSINLSNLASGMYVAKINGATSERIEKVVIK